MHILKIRKIRIKMLAGKSIRVAVRMSRADKRRMSCQGPLRVDGIFEMLIGKYATEAEPKLKSLHRFLNFKNLN